MRLAPLSLAPLMLAGVVIADDIRLTAVPNGPSKAAPIVAPPNKPAPPPIERPDVEVQWRLFRVTAGLINTLYPPEPGFLRTDGAEAGDPFDAMLNRLADEGSVHRVRHAVVRGETIRRFEFTDDEMTLFQKRISSDDRSMMLSAPLLGLRWNSVGETATARRVPFVADVRWINGPDGRPVSQPTMESVPDGLRVKVVVRREADGIIDLRTAFGLSLLEFGSEHEGLTLRAGPTTTAIVQTPKISNQVIGLRTRAALGKTVVVGPFQTPLTPPPAGAKKRDLDTREQWFSFKVSLPATKVAMARPSPSTTPAGN